MNLRELAALCLVIPSLSHAGCNFVDIEISESIGRGKLNHQSGMIDVVKNSYTGETDEYTISWYLLSDISTGITIKNKADGTQCESLVKGEFFSEPIYKLDDQDVFAIKHGIGSNYVLEFYHAKSCELLGKADVSTGSVFLPDQHNANRLLNPGYCKCENRSNDCVGEPSYCFAGEVYLLNSQCVPNSTPDSVETSTYNKQTYGVDFSGWTNIGNAKTEHATIDK